MREVTSECDRQSADIERCRRQIATLEAQILAGHPDLPGLCLVAVIRAATRILFPLRQFRQRP